MKIYQTFLLLTRGKQIAVAVCIAHFLAIFFLLGHHLISRRWKPPRPMVVKTISIHAEPKIQEIKAKEGSSKSAVATTTPKPITPTKKEASTTPKPIASAKKGGATKAKPVAKKSPPLPVDEEDTFLKEIASSLQNLKIEGQKPSRPTLHLPKEIKRKTQLTQEIGNVDPTYSEFLIAYLQNALDLPEFGEVKAKLEIDRFGKLVDLEILEAKSDKNAEFLKAELSQLDFPTGIGDAPQVFTIIFRNI